MIEGMQIAETLINIWISKNENYKTFDNRKIDYYFTFLIRQFLKTRGSNLKLNLSSPVIWTQTSYVKIILL